MIERPASELLPLLARGEVSAASLTAAYFDAIRRRDPNVRAFLHVDEAGVDRARHHGRDLSRLP